VPLTKAFKGISSRRTIPIWREFFFCLSDIDEGSLCQTASKGIRKFFSDLYVNMVQSGEVSGIFKNLFEDLANNIEKNYNLTQKVKGVLYYPAFIMLAFFAVSFLMLTFVIPKLMSMLKETNAQLPITTKMLLVMGDLCKMVVGGPYSRHSWSDSHRLLYQDGRRKKRIRCLIHKNSARRPSFEICLSGALCGKFGNIGQKRSADRQRPSNFGRVIGNSVFEADIMEAAKE